MHVHVCFFFFVSFACCFSFIFSTACFQAYHCWVIMLGMTLVNRTRITFSCISIKNGSTYPRLRPRSFPLPPRPASRPRGIHSSCAGPTSKPSCRIVPARLHVRRQVKLSVICWIGPALVITHIPIPSLCQVNVQRTLHHLGDVFANHWEELPPVERATCREVQVGTVGMPSDEEIMCRGDCIPTLPPMDG